MAIASATFSDSATIPAPAEGFLRQLLRHRLAQVGLLIILLLTSTALLTLLADKLDPGFAHHTNPNAPVAGGISELGQPAAPGTQFRYRVGTNTKTSGTDSFKSEVDLDRVDKNDTQEIKPGQREVRTSQFRLGADTLGRDVMTRMLYGTRISLIVALCAMITAVTIGTTIGLLGGYFGGWVDTVLTRLTEAVMCLPTALLAITLLVVLPGEGFWPRLLKLLAAIGLVTWTGIARAVRGQVLSLKEQEFIEAARAIGCSPMRIIIVHLLPNVLPTVIVLATLATAHNILLEAGLSYLGLGMEPGVPSWGGMINEGQPYIIAAPWITLVPGCAIVLAVAGFNLLGQALQETIEPRP